MSDVTPFQALKGEGDNEPLQGEGGDTLILPEFSPPPRPAPPPPPLPPVVALCPGVECCDVSPFVYKVASAQPTLGILSGDTACSTCLNAAYSTTITAKNIGPGLTWTIIDGFLPPGLTFHGGYNEAGQVVIDGTPTANGSFSITVKATNINGASVTAVFPLNVFGITTASLPDYVVGEFYYFQLQAAGGSGNYGWSIESGALPDGLALTPANGVITGTPTGLTSGIMPIVFKVVDITCEQFNPVFVPHIRISATSSNTRIATVLGYSEFPGLESTPPKKYHKVTWSGTSEQQLWVGGDGTPHTPPVATQIGGARYDYSGFDHIDAHGTVDSVHVKNLSTECNGDSGGIYSMIESFTPVIGEPALTVGYNFIGYYGLAGGLSPNYLGHPTVLCGSPSLPYSFVANVAHASFFNAPDNDVSGLWGSRPTNDSPNLGIANYNRVSATLGQCVDSGAVIREITRYLPIFGVVYTGVFPIDYDISGTVIWDHNFSCEMSEEYTDAEALANAQTIIGNAHVAENLPRTTGFVSRFTSVNFDLTCSNLTPGVNYIATIEYDDLTAGTQATQSFLFLANASTHVINATIPNPPAGHSVSVTKPTIAFA